MKKKIPFIAFYHKLGFCFAFALLLAASSAYAQAPAYFGALLYSIPQDTSVPPLYTGQPSNVALGYLWLADLMRLDPEPKIETYFNTLTWNDTAKTIASYIYQIQDDNPLSFFMWSGKAMKPNPYKGDPGQGVVAFEEKASHLAADTGRTFSLLTADIIADVIVGDTVCYHDPTAFVAKNMVLVNTTILDEIKGKKITSCPSIYNARKKGALPQSDTTPAISTFADTASAGTCLQFQYSPAWGRVAGDDMSPSLMDSAGGWWIKPGQEYVVFLNFVGIGHDSIYSYFTVWPGPAAIGNSGGMYPVVGGIVQDPYDDYGLGASVGLTVAEWKSRLRARIYTLTHP